MAESSLINVAAISNEFTSIEKTVKKYTANFKNTMKFDFSQSFKTQIDSMVVNINNMSEATSNAKEKGMLLL